MRDIYDLKIKIINFKTTLLLILIYEYFIYFNKNIFASEQEK